MASSLPGMTWLTRLGSQSVSTRANDGGAGLVALSDGDLLHAEVDNEEGARERLHLLDAAEVLVQALDLLIEADGLLLGEAAELAALSLFLEPVHMIDAAFDGLPVGEGAAEPPLVDVEHAAPLGPRWR